MVVWRSANRQFPWLSFSTSTKPPPTRLKRSEPINTDVIPQGETHVAKGREEAPLSPNRAAVPLRAPRASARDASTRDHVRHMMDPVTTVLPCLPTPCNTQVNFHL